MIISPSRLEDTQVRFLMLEAMEISLRHGLTDTARSIGESSAAMKKRIETKDYSREDKLLQLIQH